MLKFFYPYENYTLITKFEREEIISRVNNLVERSKVGFYMIEGNKHSYNGEVSANHFVIRQRRQTSGNILLPDIKANIEKLKKDSMLNISIELNAFSKLLLIVWVLGMSAICGLIANISVQQGKIGWNFAIPIIVLFLFYAMVLFGYRLNIYREKKFLNNFLETETRLTSEKIFN